MKFVTERSVRFSDCDPAGIVFFPQYLVMLNDLLEEWFETGLHIGFARIVGESGLGLPTVRLEVDFTAVSRHGERLTLSTWVGKLGRSSLTLCTEFHGGEELRVRVRQVLVCTSIATHRPQALPDDLRAALAAYRLEPDRG
jgi:4-hydroxybenzoyl-CoA thioesterase